MKVKPFIWLLMLVQTHAAFAQDYDLGARAQALGGSGVAHADDPEGQFTNPAALIEVPGKAVTLFYSRPFGIKELTLSSVSASVAFAKMSFGGAVVQLGHEAFDDQTYLLTLGMKSFLSAHSRKAAKSFAWGLQSAWRNVRISGYETQQAWHLSAGGVVPISREFTWGAAFGSLIGSGRDRPPRSLTLGLSYRSSDQLVTQIDFFKQSGFTQEFRGGMEMRLLEPLILRAGFGTNPDRFTVGLAFALKPATLHFTTFSHFDLGWTQQYAVTLHP